MENERSFNFAMLCRIRAYVFGKKIDSNGYLRIPLKRKIVIIFFLLLSYGQIAASEVIGGAISLNQTLEEPIALDGTWKFFWKQHIDPKANAKAYSGGENLNFLTDWRHLPQKRLDRHGFGYASYLLEINSQTKRNDLAVFIPHFYNNYRLYLNGELIAQNGEPALQEQKSEPFWSNTVKPIALNKGENTLVIHASNFQHHRGGASAPLKIGGYAELQSENTLSNSLLLIVAGAFLISAIFALTLFNFQRKEYSFLFFGLFAVFYTYRVLSANSHLLQEFFPDFNWYVSVRLEYISFYLSAICFTYFYRFLIEPRVPQWLYHTVAGVSGVLLLSTMFSAQVFTSVLDYYQAFLALSFFIIGLFHVVRLRFRNPMAVLTTISVLTLVGTMAYKAAVYYNWTEFNPWITFAGYMLFIGSQAISLGQRLGFNLRRETNRTKEAKQSQRHFLNSVSHELRTPMNAILGMTDWLSKSDLTDEQKEKLKTIQNNGTQLNTLLLDLLNFSALDSGSMKLDKKKFNLSKVVGEVAEKCKQTYKSKGIDLVVDYDKNIPDELVADEERLALVIHHLLDNAFKYSEKGKIHFEVKTLNRDNKRTELSFKIKDAGKGISKKELDHVLEAFYQGEQGNTRSYGGTGLGLTVSAQLVELMGGDLWIDSKLGEGTTVRFDVVLPMPVMDLAKEKEKAKEGSGDLNPNLRIMYAEDNPINQKLLKMMLKTLGYDIQIANNGLEAWELAISNKFDIIFMDIQMPKMDGIEATKRIIDDVPDRPIIIAVTANAETADQERCAEAGINDFISKPFNAKTIKQHLIKWQGLSNYMASGKREDVQRLIS